MDTLVNSLNIKILIFPLLGLAACTNMGYPATLSTYLGTYSDKVTANGPNLEFRICGWNNTDALQGVYISSHAEILEHEVQREECSNKRVVEFGVSPGLSYPLLLTHQRTKGFRYFDAVESDMIWLLLHTKSMFERAKTSSKPFQKEACFLPPFDTPPVFLSEGAMCQLNVLEKEGMYISTVHFFSDNDSEPGHYFTVSGWHKDVYASLKQDAKGDLRYGDKR